MAAVLFATWHCASAHFTIKYEFVVLVELARLTITIYNAARKAQGENAPFPQLGELHRKLMLSKNRHQIEEQS